MTTGGYYYFAGLLLLATAYNSTLCYRINWVRVATAFCVLTVAVGVGPVAGVVL